VDWLNNHSGAIIAVVTALGVLVAAIYAYFTYGLWQSTQDLVRLTLLIDETRLSIEQNWRLWEHRKEVHIPVASESLTDEQWKWRLPLLNHFNLLLLAYRRHMLDIDKSTSKQTLDNWVLKSQREISNVRNNPDGKKQLKLLFQEAEGFPRDFVSWMKAKGIIIPDDLTP
jgi:hypothetical protein